MFSNSDVSRVIVVQQVITYPQQVGTKKNVFLLGLSFIQKKDYLKLDFIKIGLKLWASAFLDQAVNIFVQAVFSQKNKIFV